MTSTHKSGVCTTKLTASLLFVCGCWSQVASAQQGGAEETTPSRLEGPLGDIPAGLASEPRVPESPATDYRLPDEVMHLLNAGGDEVWRLRRWSEDEQGKRHYRMRQYIGGLEVVGGEIIVHADAKTGTIEALDAQFLPSRGLPAAPLTTSVAVPAAVARQTVLTLP